MGTLALAAKNFVPNFVVAFAVGTVLRDRRTGLEAGLALGVVAAVAAVLLSDRPDDAGEEFASEPAVGTGEAEAEA